MKNTLTQAAPTSQTVEFSGSARLIVGPASVFDSATLVYQEEDDGGVWQTIKSYSAAPSEAETVDANEHSTTKCRWSTTGGGASQSIEVHIRA